MLNEKATAHSSALFFFKPYVTEDLSDDDNDYGEEEEEDDGGDSDYETKKTNKGRQATAKRKRAEGIPCKLLFV